MKQFKMILFFSVICCILIFSCTVNKTKKSDLESIVNDYCNLSLSCKLKNSFYDQITLIFDNTNDDSIIIENPLCTGIVQFKLYTSDNSQIMEKYIHKPGPGCAEGKIFIPKKSKKEIVLSYSFDDLYDLEKGKDYTFECYYKGLVYNKSNNCIKPKNITIKSKSGVIKEP